MSATPRTDMEEYPYTYPEHPHEDYVDSSFARKLERELTATTLKNSELKRDLHARLAAEPLTFLKIDLLNILDNAK